VEDIEKNFRELLTLEEINLEIQRATDEQAEIDRATQEAPAKSETRVTPEREGKDATPAEGLTSPTPEDIIAMQQKRYAAWYEIVNTPPEPSLLEPVLPIEDQ
jgi:hypothetical protein